MADLITLERALYNLDNRTTTDDEDTTIEELITACSLAIENYCQCGFSSSVYDELYHGNNQRRLLLQHYPIISVERVAYQPVAVLKVINTSTSNQRATVSVTDVGLLLTRVASGVSTSSPLLFEDYATLDALRLAIIALGNGWSATLGNGGLENYASTDIRLLQGCLNAKSVYADIKLHLYELSDFEIDGPRGWLLRGGIDLAGFQPETLTWTGGSNYWRVIYTAGYTTVPEDVQEACAQWVASLFWQTKRDPLVSQQSVPGQLTQSWPSAGTIPPGVKALLVPYRKWSLARE